MPNAARPQHRPYARLGLALAGAALLPVTAAAFPDSSLITDVPTVAVPTVLLPPDAGQPASAGGAPPKPPDTAHQIQPAGAPPPTVRAWTVLPSVNLGVGFDDNIFQTRDDRQGDLITAIAPAVTIIGDTRRLQAVIQYAPVAELYASHSSLNSVTQNLNATAKATLLEDTLFLDLRGYATSQPTFGGIPIGALGGLGTPGFGGISGSAGGAASGSLLVGKQNLTQTYSFYAAPYAVQRFGSVGTLKLGLAVSRSLQDSGSSTPITQGALAPGNTNLLTTQQVAQFTTGEAFGRLRDIALLQGNQYSGGGVTNSAYGYLATNQVAYALTRTFAVFAEAGAEDIRFGGTPVTRIQDAVWAAGIEYTPRPDATITVGYGHKFGFDSLIFDGSYALTARTTIFGRYSSGLGTDLLQFQSLVAASTIDAQGQTVGRQSQSPLFLTNSALSVQGNSTLFRIKSFSAGVTTRLDRDTISLAVALDNQTAVATTLTTPGGAPVPAGGTTEALTASITWQHQLSPLASATLYAGWGRETLPSQLTGTAAGTGTERDSFAAGQLTFSYLLSPTLTAYAQYTYFQRSSDVPERAFNQNVFLVGLGKTF